VHSLNCSNDLFPVAILLQPVVPIAATKILDYLAVPEDKRSLTEATLLSDDEQVMGAVLSNSKSFVTFPKIHSERRKQ
jgi:methionyl-tRNA synthetase